MDRSTNLDGLNKTADAVLFAVYLSAVISVNPEQCISQIGKEQEVAIQCYQFATEQALARAGLLSI